MTNYYVVKLFVT